MKEEPVGGDNLSPNACDALREAVKVISKEHNLQNGSTALYFNLVGVVDKHIAESVKEPELLVGVCDYFATGEGRTIYIYAEKVTDEQTLLDHMKERLEIDPYFMIGVKVFKEVDYPNQKQLELCKLMLQNTGYLAFNTHYNFS